MLSEGVRFIAEKVKNSSNIYILTVQKSEIWVYTMLLSTVYWEVTDAKFCGNTSRPIRNILQNVSRSSHTPTKTFAMPFTPPKSVTVKLDVDNEEAKSQVATTGDGSHRGCM